MKSKVSLIAVGDVFLGLEGIRLVKEDYKFPFLNVHDLFEEEDLVFGNLEGPLSNNGKSIKKSSLYSPPDAIHSLKYAEFNILSLANNHVFDYGESAFLETTKLLEENDINYCGAGRNLEEARRPAIFHIKGIKIAFLAYSWDFIQSIYATKKSHGVAPLKANIIKQDILNIRNLVDVIIVSLHWSYEGERYPLPSQRNLAHKTIDSGADLIIGHHPHVLQGIEHYKNGVIAYSLGNFAFFAPSYFNFKRWKGLNEQSAIFECEIFQEGIGDVNIVPIRLNDLGQPTICQDHEILSNIENLSTPLNNLSSKRYASFWRGNRSWKDLPDLNGFYKPKLLYFRAISLARRVIKHLIKRIT